MDVDREQRLGCMLATGDAGIGTLLGLILVVVGPAVAFVAVVVVVMFDRPSGPRVDVQAVGHRWTRITRVEELQRVSFVRPCDTPLPDGELVGRETHEGRERCRYEADSWRKVDEHVAEGEGTDLGAWPEGPDDGCETVGCRRSVEGSERLYVVVERPGAWVWTTEPCLVEGEDLWRLWAVGDGGTMVVGRFTRGPYCTTLQRAP